MLKTFLIHYMLGFIMNKNIFFTLVMLVPFSSSHSMETSSSSFDKEKMAAIAVAAAPAGLVTAIYFGQKKAHFLATVAKTGSQNFLQKFPKTTLGIKIGIQLGLSAGSGYVLYRVLHLNLVHCPKTDSDIPTCPLPGPALILFGGSSGLFAYLALKNGKTLRATIKNK